MPDEEEPSTALIAAVTKALAEALRIAIPQVTTSVINQPESTSQVQPKVSPFKYQEYRSSDGTTVDVYFKRFGWALQLSKISEEEYSNFARVHMGAELDNALKILVAPDTPESRTYQQICTVLIAHFDVEKNKYAESVKYRLIIQLQNESIDNFSQRLKQGATFCEYDIFLDRMLIEQLLHGLTDRDMRDEIIAKIPITFKDAYEIAHTLESTRQTADAVTTTSNKIHALFYSTTHFKHKRNTPHTSRSASRKQGYGEQQGQYACFGCGEHHKRSECLFRTSECHICKKRGHIAKVCKASSSLSTSQIQSSEEPAQQIDTLKCLNTVEEIHVIDSCGKKMLQVLIEVHKLNMELDSGAPYGFIGSDTLRNLKPNFQLQPTSKKFMSYSQHHLNCIGTCAVKVSFGSTSRQLPVYVIQGSYDSLFGREWIAQFSHEINRTELFSPVKIKGTEPP